MLHFVYLQPIDSKRDEFRKFLERSGLIDLVSKCFIKLYEETDKPENPIEYFRENIGDALKEKMTIKMLQAELEDAKKEIENLRKQINEKNGDDLSSINKSTDSNMTIEDVTVVEEKTSTPEKIEVEKIADPVEEESSEKPIEVIAIEDEKVKVEEEKEKKDESMEVIEADVKTDKEVEVIKPEEPTKIELVEENESSKVASPEEAVVVVVAATTESDPSPIKPEEVTKESP